MKSNLGLFSHMKAYDRRDKTKRQIEKSAIIFIRKQQIDIFALLLWGSINLAKEIFFATQKWIHERAKKRRRKINFQLCWQKYRKKLKNWQVKLYMWKNTTGKVERKINFLTRKKNKEKSSINRWNIFTLKPLSETYRENKT